MRWHMFLASRKLTTFTPMNKGVVVRYDRGPNEPLHVCLPYERPCSRVTTTNPCMDVLQNSTTFVWVIHFIRVSLTPHRKSSSFSRVYCHVRLRNRSCSTLSSGKSHVLRYIMNEIRQSEWISITLSDLVMFSLGGGVFWDDSVALVAFAKAFKMFGS
jgi:hypothetical protein